MRIKICLLVLFLLTFTSLFAQNQERSLLERQALAAKLPKKVDFWSKYDNDILAQALVDRMTDSELLSQILMFGWAGQEPSTLLNRWVTERGLGSVKVFGWNTDNIHNVAKAIKTLQTEAAARPFKIPLFVATDQEGGWIRHVKGETSDTPGNMAIGASAYPSDAYYSGFYINREIKALGINMNFAPSVDLYTNLDSTVIGPRSFGSDPDRAGVLGEAFAQGSLAAGVIPTAKHFPGHGDTSLDSHGRLPQIEIDLQTLQNRELVPFKYLIRSQIPAVMSGHLSFPLIEKDGTPASLSKYFLTDILRNQLGYKGLVITDDMMMNGATLFAGSLHRAVTLAIEAGNDIIISSTTASLDSMLWEQNLSRMATNSAFKNRVKESAYRVIFAKLNYFKSGNAAPLYPDESKIEESIPDKEGQRFFLDQACRSVSLYKANSSFPYKAQAAEKVLIASPFLSFQKEGRRRYPQADTYYFAYDLASDQSNYDQWNATNLLSIAQGYDTVIINVFDRHSANIARRLERTGCRIIILSTMSPVFVLQNLNFADVILCGYSYSTYSHKALFAALAGDFEPVGRVPLDGFQ